MFPLSAHGRDFDHQQIEALKRIEASISVVKDLVDHRIITEEQGVSAESFLREQGTPILGHAATVAEIASIAKTGEKEKGFGGFLNTVIVLAGIFMLIALVGLLGYYFWDFLRSLPSLFYECAAYIVTGIFLLAGYCPPIEIWILRIQPLWFVVPAAFAFAGCVYLSYWLHWVRHGDRKRADEVHAGPYRITFPQVLFGLSTLVWGFLAIVYHQAFPAQGIPKFLAFITVMALQFFMGFSVMTLPGCIALGWETEKKVPRSTVSALIILAAYVFIKLSGHSVPEEAKLFETGCLFMGAFVYFLGLLVMSSKWYTPVHENFPGYAWMQVITIVSGSLAFYLGSTFNIGSLLGVGGTFFSIYLLEKYYEIPWKRAGIFWSLLGVAVALYFFVGFAGAHPQFFIWGVR